MSMIFLGVGLGGAAIAGVAGVVGSVISSNATHDAANTQAQAATSAADLQYKEFEEQQKLQQPWIQAGAAALPQLSKMASNPAQFTQQDFKDNMDPAYQFDLQQGQQALERSAAAKGTLMSGGTLKDLTSYAQGTASNEYQNAYSRFMNNQNTQFNRLASVAGIGQTGTNQLSQAGMATANNVGNLITGSANAQASSQIAQGTIWGNTISSLGSGIGNSLMSYGMMNRMQPPSPPGGGRLSGLPTADSSLQMPQFGSGLASNRPISLYAEG